MKTKTHNIQIIVNKQKLVNHSHLKQVQQLEKLVFGANLSGRAFFVLPIPNIPASFVHAPSPLALRSPSLLSLPPPPPRVFVACEICARIWETGWNMCAR